VGPGVAGHPGLWAVSILGSAPRKLRDDVTRASVAPDGAHIAFITRRESELWVMGPNGEDARKFAEAGEGARFVEMQWSQDGKWLAYLKRREAEQPEASIEARPLEGGASRRIAADPRLLTFCWTPDGRLIYSRSELTPNEKYSNLWQLAVDARTARVSGQPQRITDWPGFSFWDLTVTADSQRLVFVKQGLQTAIFVGELEANASLLQQPRRLTLDEQNDLPSAWTPDSQSVLFYSDRNGNWDIFRQSTEQRTAEDFVLGGGQHSEPRLSPDGAWVLYWTYPKGEGGHPASMKLVRVPAAGGPLEPVLEAAWGARFRCATKARAACVLSEPDKDRRQLTFTAFDPVQGREGEAARLATDPASQPAWDLSPAGSRLAIVDFDERKDRVRILGLPAGETGDLPVKGSTRLTGVAWSADGAGIFVSSISPSGSELLHLDLNGGQHELWATSTSVSAPVPSPDRKKLAFAVSIQNSNAWMIEKF